MGQVKSVQVDNWCLIRRFKALRENRDSLGILHGMTTLSTS